MKPLISSLAATAVVIGLTHAAPTFAGEQPNVLVMGEDADKDTVPRNSRVFKRVLDALANEMNQEGFAVYDEVAVTLDDFNQGRTRRTDAEIIDIARSVNKPPMDVAVIYSIYASAQKTSYTLKVRARITGRLLNVQSGRRLGNFEVELPQADNVPTNCNRECILETVGKNAKMLARDLGAVLAKKLDFLSPTDSDNTVKDDDSKRGMSQEYSLVFEGFTADDLSRIEEYMVAFKGYKKHRPTSTSLRIAEYWYESDSDVARLNRNLRRMLEHMGTNSRLVQSGNTFTLEKITKPKKRN